MRASVSVVMTTFERDELLALCLPTVARQMREGIEIIVVNDGRIGNVPTISRANGARYYWTGQRHTSETLVWRSPGIALNYGIKRAVGDVVLLTCAEIWNVDGAIDALLAPLEAGRDVLCIPRDARDDDGRLLRYVRGDGPHVQLNQLPVLKNTHLPFFLAVRREHLLSIGGYDEDFIGFCWEDDDLVSRLRALRLQYERTDACVAHLYHGRNSAERRAVQDTGLNRRLYLERRGTVVRNVGRAWGEG